MKRLFLAITVSTFLVGCSNSGSEVSPITLSTETGSRTSTSLSADTSKPETTTASPTQTTLDPNGAYGPAAIGPTCAKNLAPVRALLTKTRLSGDFTTEEYDELQVLVKKAVENCSVDEYAAFQLEVSPEESEALSSGSD